jgi:hypothetical protein
MKTTVIVPLYNKAPYIERALTSVFRQSDRDFEIIVVDDGSTDDGPEIVADFVNGRCRLIRQPNAGPGAARNRGLTEAAGQYIAFLDADDCWRPTYLEQGIGLLEEDGGEAAAVTCGYFEFPPGTSTQPLWEQRGLRSGHFRIQADYNPQLLMHLLAYMSPCTTIARSAAVRRYGGFFSQSSCLYGEDSYLWLKMLLNETIIIQMQPNVDVHRDASELSNGRARPRAVEPLLTHSAELFAECPQELHSLLQKLLTLRAMKTAAVLGYWGRWREGRSLLAQFVTGQQPNPLRFVTAQMCASPLGSLGGRLCRMINSRRKPGVRR